MRQLKHFIESPRPCSYLPGVTASLEHRLLVDVTAEELEGLLERGWRRFGPGYFRPACAPCQQCDSLRIPVREFVPRESQKRAMRRNRRFRWVLGRPRVDEQRLQLYDAWHADREQLREWPSSELDAEDYALQFAFPHPAVRELAAYQGEELVALGICDFTPRAVSAVYFFYHPRIARLSPGVANVMILCDLARQQGLTHLYLGYRVEGCPSLRYKGEFRPHEMLVGRPAHDEAPQWRRSP